MKLGSVWLAVIFSLKSAFKTFSRNKARSFLTTLGIIIGVAAVIATTAIGQGASNAIQETINSMGSNMLVILSGTSTHGGVKLGFSSTPTLTLSDAYAIRKEKAVKTTTADIGIGEQVIWRGNNWFTTIMGSNSTFPSIRDWPVGEGAFFTHSQISNASNVAVIGKTSAKELFGLINPLGHIILIHNIPFKIIGVLSRKGFNAFGQDQDDIVIIPITTMMIKIAGTTWVRSILVSAKSAKETVTAQAEITRLLRRRHHIRKGQADDFFIRNLTEIASAANQSTSTFTILLASIATISLLVGGIGIMNIMLVSVTERTKEIGIRMAVGARKRDILQQFLIEAAVLSLFGGIIGIFIGFGISYLISILSPLKTVVTIIPVIVSIIFSICVGIFFGFYPAYKASRMNPVEALRYE